MLVVTNEPLGFLLLASMTGIVISALIIAVGMLWGRRDD